MASRKCVALWLAAVSCMLVVGCGNFVTAVVVGRTGITVNQAGEPVVLIQVCTSTIDGVTIAFGGAGFNPDGS